MYSSHSRGSESISHFVFVKNDTKGMTFWCMCLGLLSKMFRSTNYLIGYKILKELILSIEMK